MIGPHHYYILADTLEVTKDESRNPGKKRLYGFHGAPGGGFPRRKLQNKVHELTILRILVAKRLGREAGPPQTIPLWNLDFRMCTVITVVWLNPGEAN